MVSKLLKMLCKYFGNGFVNSDSLVHEEKWLVYKKDACGK